jgi:predicted phage terminase large subunit-like protein
MKKGQARRALVTTLQRDLLSFVIKCFSTVDPATTFLYNWHLAAIVYQLMLVYRGETIRLLVNQPPRSLKSLIISVAFVAWWLGHDPTRRIIVVSYSNELAAELHRQFRMIVDSDWYRALFPKMRIAKDTGIELVTMAGGGRYATSVGGTLMGRGGNLIIVDDPQKLEEVMSEAVRNQAINWFRETVVSRLNDPERGAIIVVQQRLHQDDLSGNLLTQGIWDHFVLPAIAVEDSEIPLDEDEVFLRRGGDVLHPERQSRAALDRAKLEMGSFAFAAQYQQQPLPVEGNLVRAEWFPRYDRLPACESDALVYQSWDFAGTIGAGSDFSVCITAQEINGDLYIRDVFRGQLESPELRRMIETLAVRSRPSAILFEEDGLGTSLLQLFARERPGGMPRPIGRKPEVGKLDRLRAAAIKIEAGHVWLPREAPWIAGFLAEVLAAPYGKHDDQVDALAQLVNWVFTRPAPPELPELAISYIPNDNRSPFTLRPHRWDPSRW